MEQKSNSNAYEVIGSLVYFTQEGKRERASMRFPVDKERLHKIKHVVSRSNVLQKGCRGNPRGNRCLIKYYVISPQVEM